MKHTCRHCGLTKEYTIKCRDCEKSIGIRPTTNVTTTKLLQLQMKGSRTLGNNAAINKVLVIIGEHKSIAGLDGSTRNILSKVASQVRELKK